MLIWKLKNWFRLSLGRKCGCVEAKCIDLFDVQGIYKAFVTYIHVQLLGKVFKIFSASFLIALLSPEMATSISMHVLFSLYYYYYYYYYHHRRRHRHHHHLVITFMQDIYNYTPETNPVSKARSFAAVLYLQSVLHVMLFSP